MKWGPRRARKNRERRRRKHWNDAMKENRVLFRKI
jgi:hypothetical protein